jgi:hypothetical protein
MIAEVACSSACDRRPESLAIDHDRTVSTNSINMMSAPVSYLTILPIEILEQICLHLPGQDIIRMEAVREVVSHSVRF